MRAILPLAALGLLLAAAGLNAQPLSLQTNQPIETGDRLLRRQGWQPDGDPNLDSFDRELSGNALSSLTSCSGTGAGFCRYQYRRGRERLEVITVPNRDGDGLVHHWQRLQPGSGPPAARP